MRIEIELPEIEGFEYTGEYRAPKLGESFLNYQGEIITFLDGSMDEINPILRKLDPPNLEDRIKAEFSDKHVVMLEFMQEGDDKRESLKITSDDYSYECHSGIYHEDYLSAQGMKGFYKYVYEVEAGKLFPQRSPTTGHGIDQETIMPVAVLFEDNK